MRTPYLFVPSCVLVVVGCAQIFGFDDLTDGAPDASQPTDARPTPSEDAATDGGSEADGGTEKAIADFYVSPLGDDLADGSIQHPLRSLRTAVDRATVALGGGARQRLAVCVGDYPEQPITVRGGIEIHGGYDCFSWERRALTDSQVGVSFESGSRVSDLAEAQALIELYDDPSGVPSLDGLNVEVSYSFVGIGIGGRGSVKDTTLTSNTWPTTKSYVTSGIGATGGDGVIEHCTVRVRHPGPIGVPAAGLGIVTAKGPHTIRRNDVSVENVTGTGVGFVSGNEGGVDLIENRFYLSDGIASGEDAITSTGISVTTGGYVRSTRNSVRIESPANATSYTQVVGFIASAQSRLVSDGDRVVGPAVLGAGRFNDTLRFFGFLADGSLERVVNSSIYLSLTFGFRIELSAGIRLIAPSSASILHNTMYFSAGAAVASESPIHALSLANAALAPPSNVRFDRNLVVLAEPSMSVVRAECGSVQFAGIEYNRHTAVAAPGTGRFCDGGVALAALWPEAGSSDNVELACDGGCGGLLDLDAEHVEYVGLRLTETACNDVSLKVPATVDVTSDAGEGDGGDAGDGGVIVPRVTVDGTGAERIGPITYAGAFANCP